MNHLAILPILIPLFGAVLSLFVEHRRFPVAVRRGVAWLSMTVLLAVVLVLFARVDQAGIVVYLLGDWPSRLGIALMADRLSMLMVLVATLLAVACLLHACAGWDRRAPHFHALFQFQLMGLNGAFLTGDLFNLFVFFEVLLIASYGLMLSGGRGARMRAGLHYVTFNVAASTLFLIALGLLYGLLGSLNMAELATRVAAAPAQNLPLIRAAGGLLLLVFCAKAALLPLYLWLPETYARAPAAVAGLFAIMTKVGIYAMLRACTLVFGIGPLHGFAWDWLLPLGLATLLLAALGVLGANRLRVLTAYLVVVSAATLFVAFALAQPESLSAGLYYLAHSSFAAAALFLIADLIRRRRGSAADRKDIVAPMPDKTLPAILFLIAAVSVAGLPPLSGFIGKVLLLQSVPDALRGWVWSAILVSSFLVVIGLARAGIRLFWRVEPPADPPIPVAPARPLETAATALLLAYGIAMTLAAAPILRYTQATAAQLLSPADYVQQLRATPSASRAP